MASSSTVDKPRPPKPPGGEWIEYDQFIDRQIRKTRGQVKGVEIASALMTLATGALAFFLVAAVLDHWVLAHGLGFWGRLLCLALFLGGAGYYAAEKLLPWLIYRINPIYAAQAIEKSRPTLKNSLINFLFLRGQSAHVPKAIYEAVEQQAANGLSRVTVESAVDRSRLIHIGYALLTVVGLFAAYFLFSPKSPWDTIGRVIMPWANIQVPTRVEIIDAQPGTRTVFRGATVDVSAEIKGLKEDEPVRVVYSTADHEAVDQPVTMYLPPDRFRHSAKIPPANASGQQSAGVQQDIDYRIEAGDAVSPTYHLTAVTAPTINIDSVDYQFPDYTGRARITLNGIGDIQALEGTRVVIHGRANEPIKSAQLELIGREAPKKLAMQIGDDGKSVTGSFMLAFDEQDRTAPQFSHYLLRPEGRAQPEPVRYRIDVIRDLAPDVKFITPEKDEVALPVNGRLKLKLRALDPDFALSQLTLAAESNRTSLFEKQLLNEIRREPMQVEFTIDPAKLHLKDGDLVEYWATAKDNRQPTPNTAQTARRRIRIVAADARQGDSNQTEGDGQGAGNPADKSDKPNGADKSNDNKQPQNDAQKQDNPSADKPAGDKSAGPKSPKQQPGDKQDGAENQPENQPQDAAHDKKQDKQSPDQKQQNQNGGTKPQDPSNKQKPDGSKNNSDKQDSDNNQGANKQKPDDKQQDGGGSKSEKNGGQSSQKSDSSKGGSDSKAGGDKSGSDKSGGDKSSNDKSGGDKSSSNDSQKDNAGGQQKNADQNANPQGQRNERPASDGSDDVNAIQRTLQQLKDAAKNGSQGKPSDQSQNSDGQKQSSGEKQPGGKQSDSPNQPDSQPKPGDGQKPAGAKPQPNSQQPPNGQKAAGGQPQNSQQKPGDQSPKSADAKKPTDGQKPQDGQKPGDPSAGEKSQSGSKSAAEKPNRDQPSTKEGDAQNTGAKKDGSDKAAGDKSKGANSTKEDAPTKPSGDKADSSKSGDKSDKPGTEQNRDSTPGQNKTGNTEKPDQGNGDRTKDGSQPTSEKHPPQDEKEQSQTKAGDPDSNKGAAGAGEDTAKDDKAAPPSPSDTNKPKDHKNEKPKSAGKKETQGKDEGKSPTTSPNESDSQGDESGDRSGGGKKGGGQPSNQSGTGGAGQNTAADQGKGVAKGHGQGEDSSKAGTDKASNHKTGKSGDKEGPGSHTKAADSDHPNNPAPAKSPDDQGKSSASAPQGSAGKSPDNPSGPGSSGYEPRGGGNNSGTPPTAPPPGPETTGDAANPEFAKKQFDMALESLKKGKPDLLKELNWTPEEAQKLADRLERMRRNAEVPGAKGDDARRQMNELLQSLGTRGGQVDRRSGGNATDTQRGLRESHDAGPPPEYSEQVEAFQQGILQGGK
jgi:hypothetical protein